MTKHDEIIEEIHRIRAKIHKEDEGLTPDERAEKMNREAAEILKKHGITLPVARKRSKR
jgi:protein-tyrosine-phosphatase